MATVNSLNKILIVEDDQDYCDALCDVLRLEGMLPTGVSSVAAYAAIEQPESYALLLLDRNLPDGDGIDVLKKHRQISSVPVIFITCEGQLEDRVTGLEADADYYLVKPVQNDELMAIVYRCLRRQQVRMQPMGWVLDSVHWTLQDSEQNKISLTHTERRLLESFVGKPGVAISRVEIVKELGKDPDSYDYRRLEVAIRRLRKKIEESALSDFPLESVYGFGYVLNLDLSRLDQPPTEPITRA